jgi:hypothetical protein
VKIRAPLYFQRLGNHLQWLIWTPAGADLRVTARMEWGQFRTNRGGLWLRYYVRFIHWKFWRSDVERAKAVGA